jgi:hypothetical protein
MKFFNTRQPAYKPLGITHDIDAAVIHTQRRKRGQWSKSLFVRVLLLELVHLALFLGWMAWTEHLHVLDDELSSSCMYLTPRQRPRCD